MIKECWINYHNCVIVFLSKPPVFYLIGNHFERKMHHERKIENIISTV